jgi:Secretion system C-terminal sorting domain
MLEKNKIYATIICVLAGLSLQAASLTTIRSGSWYDATIWNAGRMPTKWDKATIAAGTTVTVVGPYTDCDSLIINGFLDVGAANLTIGGRDLQIDVRAVRNTECIINGKLRINGNWNHQFKVYGNVKFNRGSIFEMTAGAVMIDGCAFTEALSVPAHKALLDVTDAAIFSSTGGIITMFNPHYHATGFTIKGAKTFHNVSFGNNLTLWNFACRNTSDFIFPEWDKPIFNAVRLAYLPHPQRQNKVIFNNVNIIGGVDIAHGVLAGAGRIKIGGDILMSANARIEADIECNHTGRQSISTYFGNQSALIKGNLYINNSDYILIGVNLEIQNGTLHLLKGKVQLNDKTLTLNHVPNGGSGESYVITSAGAQKSSTLLIKNLAGRVLFPVGTETSYVPVILTGIGDFRVAAKPLYDSNPLGINVQWQINQVSGASPTDIQVHWNVQNENYGFKKIRHTAQLQHWENNTWTPVNQEVPMWKINEVAFTKKVYKLSSLSTFTIQGRRFTANKVQRLNASDEFQAQLPDAGLSFIYPNPISTEPFLNLSLNADNQSNTQIIIFNVNQQLVYQNTFSSGNDLKIPVANLPTGLYSIQILNEGQQYHHKFVKN